MKKTIRQIILKLSPELFYAISSYRFFRRCKDCFQVLQNEFASKVYGDRPIMVLSGPFADLAYYNKIIWGPVTPKWIGSYENELHGVMAEILNRGYGKIIDVGAAEGYYAVGFALKCPTAQVISYDIDPIARYRQKQLARLNSITNLEVRKYCSHAELTVQITGRCFVMSDVEGFELELLDPVKCPALRHCDVLVEIHPSNGLEIPAVEHIIAQRFAATHSIRRFGVTARDPEYYRGSIPALKDIPAEVMSAALDEHRNSQQLWLWMEAP